MTTADPWSRTDELDQSLVDVMVTRLEARGKYPPFLNMLNDYLEAMRIDAKQAVLDLGTGSGFVARTIAARNGFSGHVLGIDLSPELVKAAARLAEGEGLEGKVSFEAGDTRGLKMESGSFDAVIAHTLLSHVPDPVSVIAEISRLLRPGGVVGIFDGDFASKTFAQEDPQKAKAQDELITNTMTANPYVMRLMPRYLKQAGLELTDFFPYVLAEVGKADYWKSSLEANRRLIPQTGIMTRHEADAWASGIMKSSDEGVFFGANNYYAYVVRKP